jgi:hypothetical protein
LDAAVKLVERHQAAVRVAPLGVGASGFPENHPLFAGFCPPAREKIVTCWWATMWCLLYVPALISYQSKAAEPSAGLNW